LLRAELLLPSDVALYLAWRIDHERATEPFARLLTKFKWLPSSHQIDWVRRVEHMMAHSDFELNASATGNGRCDKNNICFDNFRVENLIS
jgi:hypothetical protein